MYLRTSELRREVFLFQGMHALSDTKLQEKKREKEKKKAKYGILTNKKKIL